MKVMGKKLLRVDTPEGKIDFQKRYGISAWQVIVDYDLETLHLRASDTLKHIAVMGHKSSIAQTFTLGLHDHLIVYSEQCHDRIFNTDGMAFMRLLRDDRDDPEETVAMWCLENSPYDLMEEDLARKEGCNKAQDMVDKVNARFISYQLPGDATLTNTVFVQML
jgi:hypothetical protein